MVISLLVLLAVTIVATQQAGKLAKRQGRHVFGWKLATAAFPPLALILWILPPHGSMPKA